MASRRGEINTEIPPRVIRLFNQRRATRPIPLRAEMAVEMSAAAPRGRRLNVLREGR